LTRLLFVSHQAALVDPCDAEEALAVAAAAGVTVSQLLITHHHVDHSGGNLALRRALPGCKVVGGRGENVPYATHQVAPATDLGFGCPLLQSGSQD
jgi:hydroxyacylglutathione hydrolase